MKWRICLFILLICISRLVHGQSEAHIKTVCKGAAIADGYIVSGETTSPICPNGAWIIKKRGNLQQLSTDVQIGTKSNSASHASNANASQNKLPTVDQIIEKYIQVTGGREANLRIKSTKVVGSVEVLQASDVGSFEMYAKAPNKFLAIMNLVRLGTIKQGFNGRRGWSHSQHTGVQFASPFEEKFLKRNIDFYKYLNLKVHFSTMKVVGIKNVGTASAYVIEATPANGTHLENERMYFDTQTGLLIRLDFVRDTSRANNSTDSAYLGDYREVDKIKIPFYTQQTIGNLTFITKFRDVKNNVEINDAVFDPPK